MLPSNTWFIDKNPYIFLLIYTFCSTFPTGQSENQKVLLIVLGGFNYDFLKLINTSNNTSGFGRLETLGFLANTIHNEFVTSTAPNLFSLATGLHSGYHGILDDIFFDKTLNATFDLDRLSVSRQSHWFNPELKPIWIVAQQQGRQSIVTSQWPGAESPIDGIFPTFLGHPSSDTALFNAVVGQALDVLEQKVSLSLIYHGEPKITAEKFGPTSAELLAEVHRLDKAVDQLISAVLNSPRLKQSLNVIITSDHGLVPVDRRNIIVLDEFLDQSNYTSPGPDVRAVWPIWPEPGVTADSLFTLLQNQSDHMLVHRRKDMARLFHADNARIAPIMVHAQPGWLIARSMLARNSFDQACANGYDPDLPGMSPFLMAFGPGINHVQSSDIPQDLGIVDVYPLICHLLNLDQCGPHNGSLSNLKPMLRKRENKVVGGILDVLAVALVLAVCLTTATFITVCAARAYYHGPLKTSATSQRRARQRRPVNCTGQQQQHHHPMVSRAGRRSGEASRSGSVNAGQLLTPVSDEEELLLLACENDTMVGQQRFQVDDATLTRMLHGPRSRYP